MSDPVLAATAWGDNGALIADCARLGYLQDDWRTLDPTWGRGLWWSRFVPHDLTRHDKYTLDGVDFRQLPEPDHMFDAIAYDPPYVCPGGLKTSTVKDQHDRYGMSSGGTDDEARRDFATPAELQAMLDAGLTEMLRVARPKERGYPGAVVLMKCMNYIWSGRLWLGRERSLAHAQALGFEVVDILEHVGGTGPQPQTTKCKDCRGAGTIDAVLCGRCGGEGAVPRPQVHARRNLSTLLVLRAPRATATPAMFGGEL